MTTTDLVTGRITSFRREQAFGLITLDDGTPVKFDAGICTMVPEEGAAVRIRVGPAKWGGGLKALYVESAEAGSIVIVSGSAGGAKLRSLEDQLAAVQREHLVSGLTEQIFGELLAQRFGGRPEAATIVVLLDAYYTGDPARARSDGYLRRVAAGLPHVSDDVLAELAALLPDAKLPQQVRWSGRDGAGGTRDESQVETVPYEKADVAALGGALGGELDGALGGALGGELDGALDGALGGALGGEFGGELGGELDGALGGALDGELDGALGGALAEPAGGGTGDDASMMAAALLVPAAPATALVVRDADGTERSISVGSLDDVIAVANAALRRASDGRRVYKLQTGGAWQAYFALASDRAERLASTLPFTPPPSDVF